VDLFVCSLGVEGAAGLCWIWECVKGLENPCLLRIFK
jgi:hypothetical protein